MSEKIPWIIKYRPKRISEVVNQEQAKKAIIDWLNRWPNVDKKALLLYGPPGTGKTSLVEAIANELGYELIELNASDNRRKEDIERIVLRAATTRSLIKASRKRIILLDEVDGIATKEDAGGLEAILRLISTAAEPIIMTANDPWDQKLKPLREVCEMILFKKLTKTEIKGFLQMICTKERIECEDKALDYIAERAEGDMRAAINDLEALGRGKSRVTLNEARILLRPRDKERDPFETLRMLFSANYAWQAKAVLNQSQLDYEQLKLWLEENIPYQLHDLEDIARAYEALSRADVYLGRIVRTGDWDLLSYAIDLMTAGVSFAVKNNPRDKYNWTKYSFPQRITMIAKTKDLRGIVDDISKALAMKLHISSSTAKSDVLPYLRVICAVNPRLAAQIAFDLGFSEKMVEVLAGPNKSQVLEYYRQLKHQLQDKALKIDKNKKESEPESSKKRTASSRDLLSFTKK